MGLLDDRETRTPRRDGRAIRGGADAASKQGRDMLTQRFRRGRPLGALLLLTAALGLSGCGVVAAPFRVTGAVVKAVPVVGHPIAAPLDATGDAID
jgi:hypothetical protein